MSHLCLLLLFWPGVLLLSGFFLFPSLFCQVPFEPHVSFLAVHAHIRFSGGGRSLVGCEVLCLLDVTASMRYYQATVVSNLVGQVLLGLEVVYY